MTDHEHVQEQDTPIEAGHDDASERDKVAGIAEQTKQDVAMGNVQDLEDALRQRLADAGIQLDEEAFASLLSTVRG